MNEELAELVGRHIADGYLVKNPKRNGYRVVFTENLDLVKKQKMAIIKNFRTKSIKIKPRNNIHDLITYSKELYEFLKDFIGLPQCKLKARKLITPQLVNLSLNLKMHVVKGIMDCDGSLYYDAVNNTWILELNLIHGDVVDYSAWVLGELKIPYIKFTGTKKSCGRKVSYALRIQGQTNITKYLETIGSYKFKPRFAAGSRGAPR